MHLPEVGADVVNLVAWLFGISRDTAKQWLETNKIELPLSAVPFIAIYVWKKRRGYVRRFRQKHHTVVGMQQQSRRSRRASSNQPRLPL